MSYLPVPYVFAGRTAAIPLAELDASLRYVSAKVVSVKDFGAIGDGVQDDAASIQAAIDWTEAVSGGVVWFPEGIYRIETELRIRDSQVTLLGAGSGVGPSGVAVQTQFATKILWYGAAGGTMLSIEPSSTVLGIRGGGVQGIGFDGRSVAATGVSLRSASFGRYDCYIEHCTTQALYVGVVAALSNDPRDSQQNVFILNLRQSDPTDGDCLVLDGDAGANASVNTFLQLQCGCYNGNAIDLHGADNNVFVHTRIFINPLGTGSGVVFRASAVGNTQVSRCNRFLSITNPAGWIEEVGAFSPYDNYAVLDKDNATPDPTNIAICGFARSDRRALMGPTATTINALVKFSGIQGQTVVDTAGLTESGGKVGLGTTTYTDKLNVKDTTNCIVTSEGGNGFGAFKALGSGTNATFMFFVNASGERCRITAGDSSTLAFNTGTSANTQFGITHTAGANRNIQVTGSNGGNPTMTVTGGNLAINAVVNVASAAATPAGGSTSARLLFGTTAGFGIYYGSGAPTVSAGQGSLYLRSDGSGVGNRIYVNTDGGTTWTAVTTAA